MDYKNLEDKANSEINILGAFVHGSLASLNLLGLVYNFRRRNKINVTIHSLALTYDLFSMYNHYKKIKEDKLNELSNSYFNYYNSRFNQNKNNKR